MNLVSQRQSDKKIILATRKSALAMWQAKFTQNLLSQKGFLTDMLPTVTSGDKLQKGALANQVVSTGSHLPHLETGKGLFVKEIQEHMLAGHADIAVHSMKDLPVSLTPGLSVVGILPREKANDVLILSPEVTSEIKQHLAFHKNEQDQNFLDVHFPTVCKNLLKCSSFTSGIIGTTSARRQMQMRSVFGQLINLQILRGNVDTRISRVRNNEFSAILLANAGLQRLEMLDTSHMIILPTQSFIPAPAQGIIAIETLDSRTDLVVALSSLSHLPTLIAAALERLVLELLGGDCHTALAVYFAENEISIECGKDGQKVTANYQLSPSESQFLDTLATQSKGNYSRFFADLSHSKFSKSVHTFLISCNFASVSNLRN